MFYRVYILEGSFRMELSDFPTRFWRKRVAIEAARHLKKYKGMETAVYNIFGVRIFYTGSGDEDY